MTLYQKLQQAKSEEDVKDAYIKALSLKGYSKKLVGYTNQNVCFSTRRLGHLR